MKFNLTITEMDEDDFNRVIKQLNKPLEEEIVIKPRAVEEVVEPVAPAAPVELPADTVDKDGLKWDSRIHSSNHQMTAKGVWQRRRGISDEEFNKVKNELLGVQESVMTFVAPNTIISTQVQEPHVIPMTVTSEVIPMTVPPVTAPIQLAPEVVPEPTPTPVVTESSISPDILFQTMFKKLQAGLGNNTLKGNDIRNLLDTTNTQFGLQCQNLTEFKDNVPAIQYIINELTVRGL